MDTVSAALIGASLVQFISGSFTYLNNRKTAPEVTKQELEKIHATNDGKRDEALLNFWLEQVKKVEDKQTQELNGIRQSFETEKAAILLRHSEDMRQLRDESKAEKISGDLFATSLQSEIRHIVEQRGNDQIEFQRQMVSLKDEMNKKLIEIEKEKVIFLTGMLDRFESFCRSFGGTLYDSKSNPGSSTESSPTTNFTSVKSPDSG